MTPAPSPKKPPALTSFRPSNAFVGASWLAVGVGIAAYLIGLWNSEMQLNEKGYYLIVLLFGLYAGISLQKVVRDREEGIETTAIYYGISWFALISAVVLLSFGLWKTTSLILSEKGFFLMSFTLSLFSVIVVQKNVRDLDLYTRHYGPIMPTVYHDDGAEDGLEES